MKDGRAFILVTESHQRKFVITPKTQYYSRENPVKIAKRLHGLGYKQVFTKVQGWTPGGPLESVERLMEMAIDWVWKGIVPENGRRIEG